MQEQPHSFTAADFFRIPPGVALSCFTLAFVLASLLIHEGASIVNILLLLLIASGFFLSLLDRWWNEQSPSPRALHMMIACAVIVRVAMLTTPPLFSDDVYRYAWEGKVVAAGENPYRDAPGSPALAHLRDANWERVNNKEISAIYPPLTQIIFAAASVLGGGVYLIKIIFVLADLLTGWMLWKWLVAAGLPRGRIAAWLLHPLVIVEFAGSGHLDVLVVLGLAITLFYLAAPSARSASGGAIAGLTLGALAKLIPIGFAPHLAHHLPRRHWLFLLIAPMMLITSYLPFASAGNYFFRAIDSYESRWSNNASVFHLVHGGVARLDPDGESFRVSARRIGGIVGKPNLDEILLKRRADSIPGDPNLVTTRLIVYVFYFIVWAAILCWPKIEWETRWMILLGALLLLGPINHPWYLTFLIPCMMRRMQPAVLWWSLTVLSSYLVIEGWRTDAVWRESEFAWWLQYGGLLLIAVGQAFRRFTQNHRE